MSIFALAGLAVTAAILALTLQPYQPLFAFFTALAAGLCLLAAAAGPVYELSEGLRTLIEAAGISNEVYGPVLKTVCIAATVRVVGAICKDAGQGALAVKLELAGTVAALITCFPLLQQLIELVNTILQ